MARLFARVQGLPQRIICLVVVLFLLPAAASADTITLTSSRDTTIFREHPGNSDGAGQAMIVGNDATSSVHRALIGFDILGNLPAGAIISAVQLTLVVSQAAPADMRARQIELHRLLANWGEGITGQGTGPGRSGVGFPAPSNGTTATWTHPFFNTTRWTNPGGDFAATASGGTLVGTARQAYVWDSTPAMVADVQSWLDNPDGNFGWLLLGDESANSSARRFNTREATSAAVRPALTISFTAAPVPEPSALALLAVGVLGLAGSMWRRRDRLA